MCNNITERHQNVDNSHTTHKSDTTRLGTHALHIYNSAVKKSENKHRLKRHTHLGTN